MERYAAVELITPEKAKELLNYDRQRGLSFKLKSYKQQMLEGKWRDNGEAIIISKTGKLLDGQHRLLSIIETGKEQYMTVSYGVDDDVMTTIDTGKSRSASDVFTIFGISNPSLMSAIVRGNMKLERNVTTFVGKTGAHAAGGEDIRLLDITNESILSEYQAHKSIYDTVYALSVQCYSRMKILSTTEIGSTSAYLILTKGHTFDEVFTFFRCLVGIENSDKQMFGVLRGKLVNDAISAKKIPTIMKTKLVVKVWNKYITNKDLQKVIVFENDTTNFI
jgi:hypothetical protein